MRSAPWRAMRINALLRADSEDYCLELVQDATPDHDHSAWELAADCSLDEAAAHLDALLALGTLKLR